MDAVLENIERNFLADRIRTSDSVGRLARQRLRSSFQSAFWALLFALALPLTVFIFGSIHAQEHQLQANPRWTRFVPLMNPQLESTLAVAKSQKQTESPRLPVQTASIQKKESVPTVTDNRPQIEDDMTGSVSGNHSVEVHVSGERAIHANSEIGEQYEPPERPERRFAGHRNSDYEADSSAMKATARIESQMKHVRQRLEQLAELQHVHHAANSNQQAQILEQQDQLLHREAELSVTLNELTRNINDNLTVSSIDRPAMSDEVAGEPSFTESPADSALPDDKSNEIAHSDETIRIRRDTGRDHVDVYTMKVQEADIRQFFTRLSEVARVGILPSPSVQGQISLHLHEVRLESALKAIVKSRDYVVEREHGIFVIRTAEEARKPPSTSGKLALKADGSK